MTTVIWLGPPDSPVTLIDYGVVEPGALLDLDDALAENLIKSGRAVPQDTTKTKKPKKVDPSEPSGTATAESTEITE